MSAHLPSVPRLVHPVSDLIGALGALVRAVAFWTAILIPTVYLVLFLTPEIAGPGRIGALIALHAMTLLLGHGYAAE